MKVNSFSMFGDKAKWSSGFAANIRQHFTLYWDDLPTYDSILLCIGMILGLFGYTPIMN